MVLKKGFDFFRRIRRFRKRETSGLRNILDVGEMSEFVEAFPERNNKHKKCRRCKKRKPRKKHPVLSRHDFARRHSTTFETRAGALDIPAAWMRLRSPYVLSFEL